MLITRPTTIGKYLLYSREAHKELTSLIISGRNDAIYQLFIGENPSCLQVIL